ncbi:MAG: hypothetical protein M3Q77_09005 [Thermoproteota archaeon]|nr:hypothetical protein [Thermoproteota archaeon]
MLNISSGSEQLMFPLLASFSHLEHYVSLLLPFQPVPGGTVSSQQHLTNSNPLELCLPVGSHETWLLFDLLGTANVVIGLQLMQL